jgi:hypothetical protein
MREDPFHFIDRQPPVRGAPMEAIAVYELMMGISCLMAREGGINPKKLGITNGLRHSAGSYWAARISAFILRVST